MFKSVSNCTPNSRVTVSFVATKNENLIVDDSGFAFSVLVYVNEVQYITQPIAIQVGDQVQIELNTPAQFGAHKFISYSLGGIEHSFAVVNQDNYQPTVKPNDAPRRWFNYFPKSVRTTFYENDLETQIDRHLGRALNIVDIDRAHVVLDHITNRVNFYYFNRELVTSVKMPSGPVEYVKSNYIDSEGDSRTELLVLSTNKILYRIRFNNRFSASGEFFPTVSFIRSLEAIWYEADLPTGESYVDARRNDIRQKINPPMTALDVFGNNIWAAGYDTVYILDKQFVELNKILIGTEKIVAIACLDQSNAYAVTRDGKIWHCTASGSYNLIYQTSDPLGNPARFVPPGESPCILVPDPNNRRLLKITGPSAPVLANSWSLGDFAPAYARVFDSELWVTGYDTNRVLNIKSRYSIQEYSFKEKVTVVSVEYYFDQPSILAIHYLRNYITLNLTGIRRTVPIKLDNYKGPISHIGTKPYKLILLGAESMPTYSAPGVTCWINGIQGELATTGDHFSVSYKARSVGFHSVAFVLGNRAYDLGIEAFTNIDKSDNFVASAVATNRLDYANANVIYSPTVGNVYSGSTSINLDFNIGYFGKTYTQVNVGTNGYVTFGQDRPTGVFTTIGSLDVDAIYVETGANNGDLTQTLPKTNIDGTAGTKPLPSGKTPGVYYQMGSNGDVNFLRVAWVGHGGDRFPQGNNIPLAIGVSNSVYMPVEFSNLVKANVGDYAAGTPVTAPTQVQSKLITSIQKFEAYKSLNNNLFVYSYTDSVTSVRTNSEILGAGRYIVANSKTILSSILPNGTNRNTVLASDATSITVNGFVNPAVTQYYSVFVPVLNPDGNVYKTDISSYASSEDTITVVSNIANVSVTTDFIVSNTDASFFYVGQEVLSSNIAKFYNQIIWPTVVSKTVSSEGTIIELNSFNLLESGDTVSVKKTVINFSTVDSTLGNRVALFEEVLYELSTLTLDAPAYTLEGSSIDVRGSFLVLSNPINGFAGSICNFKTEVPVKEYTYEVGFYIGKRYQYIELFYDNTSHLSSNIAVIRSGTVARGNAVSISANVNPMSSYVFYSNVGIGDWNRLGSGSFNYVVAKTSLHPTFVNVPAYSPNDANIEFLIEQEFTTASNVLLSTSFGYLTVNGGFYKGNSFIKENDIVRLNVPFNKSSRAVAPIISIGDFQFPVPMITSAAANLLINHNFLTDNYSTNSLLNYTFTVPVTDTYYFPDYYRSASAINDFTYTLIGTTGNTSLFSGNSYSLTAGRQIKVNGLLSSTAVYDKRSIVLIGQRNAITVAVRTQHPGVINYLNFGSVDKPYTTLNEYIDLPGNVILANEDVGYISNSLVVSTTANITSANLYMNDLGATFVTNGNVTNSRRAYMVPINSNIGIRRDFVDNFQSDTTVYQVYYDTYAVSNVYIPVGSWSVTNRSISNGVFAPVTTLSGTSLTNYEKSGSTISVFENPIDNLFLSPSVRITRTLEVLKSLPFQFNKILKQDSVLTIPNYLNISSRKISLDTTYLSSVSNNKFSLAFYKPDVLRSAFTGRLSNSLVVQNYSYLNNVTVDSNDILYRYITIGSVGSKYIPYSSFDLGTIIGKGADTPAFFDNNKIFGIQKPAGTAETGSMTGTNSILSSYMVGNNAGFSNPTVSLWNSILEEESEVISNLFSGKAESSKFYNFTTSHGKAESSNESTTTNLNYSINEFLETIFSQLPVEKRIVINPEDFTYWNFGPWGSTRPYSFNEFPFLTTVDDQREPATEFSSRVDSKYEDAITELYSGTVDKAIGYPIATDFLLRIQRTFRTVYSELFSGITGRGEDPKITEMLFSLTSKDVGSNFTELIFNIADPIFAPAINEFVFGKNYFHLDPKVVEIPVKPEVFISRPETAYLVAPFYQYYKPIDKLLMFFAPYESISLAAPTFIYPLIGEIKETNEYKLPLLADLKEASILKLNLISILDFASVLKIYLAPFEDKIPLRLIDFVPLLGQTPLIVLPLELVVDIVPEKLIPLEHVLYQEDNWETDDITVYGTYSTTIRTWVDQGQYSDWWNLKRKPGDVTLYDRPFNLIQMYHQEYNYVPGGYANDALAEDEKVKYYNAGILPIPGTNYWNYRIYFKQRHFCVPRKGIIFPVTWYTRGG